MERSSTSTKRSVHHTFCNQLPCIRLLCYWHECLPCHKHNSRVGQNRIYAPYMTVYFVISLPKMSYMHRIYMVLANPTQKWPANPTQKWPIPTIDSNIRSLIISRRSLPSLRTLFDVLARIITLVHTNLHVLQYTFLHRTTTTLACAPWSPCL